MCSNVCKMCVSEFNNFKGMILISETQECLNYQYTLTVRKRYMFGGHFINWIFQLYYNYTTESLMFNNDVTSIFFKLKGNALRITNESMILLKKHNLKCKYP